MDEDEGREREERICVERVKGPDLNTGKGNGPNPKQPSQGGTDAFPLPVRSSDYSTKTRCNVRHHPAHTVICISIVYSNCTIHPSHTSSIPLHHS